MGDNTKLVERIVKLFQKGNYRAGDGQTDTTEAEMMLAISKAKELMAKHAISVAEVQAALDLASGKAHRPRIDINIFTAYTRKIRNLARYDELVAIAVGHLTQTRPLVYQTHTADGWYTTMKFVGEEGDVQVAAALFMIFLPIVRKRASAEYGRGKNTWSIKHTSYAIGFASRMVARALQQAANMTPAEQKALVLVTGDKQSAIQAWMDANDVGKSKRKASPLDADSYHTGYAHGGSIDLSTKGFE
jgi:hypothetical protein